MLRTVLTTLGRPLITKNTAIIHTNVRSFASFQNRDFQFDKTNPEESGSLLTRFARHVAVKSAGTKDPITYTIRYADYFPLSDSRRFLRDLKEIPVEQLPRMVIYTSIYKGRTEVPTIVEIVNALDNHCVKKLHEMTQTQIIEMLNALMYFLPDRITQLDFYTNAIQKLAEEFSAENGAKEFMEVCFYLGLWKKNPTSIKLMNHMLKEHLGAYVDDLEPIELAIVANAAFKSSTLISNKAFTKKVESELLSMEEVDVSLLVTFLKCLRHNRVKSPETLQKIINWTKEGQFNGENVDVRATGHILTYLAENRVADTSLFAELFSQGLTQIHSETRVQDISNILWSAAHLGFAATDKAQMNRIANVIFDKYDNGNYRYFPDELVGTCLSFWMLGYKTTELTDAALQDNNYNKNQQRVRLDSRKILLQSLLQLQKSDIKPNYQLPEFLVSNRMKLQTTFEALNSSNEELGLESVQYVQQIPELNIAGIHVKTGERDFYVEVLDETNTLADNQSLLGMMKLKKVTLEHKKCFVVMVNVAGVAEKEQIEQLVKDEVRDFLGGASDDEKDRIEPSVKA